MDGFIVVGIYDDKNITMKMKIYLVYFHFHCVVDINALRFSTDKKESN